jgi:hypothetical protein
MRTLQLIVFWMASSLSLIEMTPVLFFAAMRSMCTFIGVSLNHLVTTFRRLSPEHAHFTSFAPKMTL